MEYYYLSGEIDASSVDPIIEILIDINCRNFKGNYNLLINSNGGDLFAALSLIDMMKSSKVPIHTYGIGEVSSAAFMILISGKKRYASEKCLLMSHKEFYPSVEGSSNNFKAYLKSIEMSSQIVMNLYKEATKLDEKFIEEHLLQETDVYLSSEEALKYNLIDKIGTML